MRLSTRQKDALLNGSAERWNGAATNGAMGNTMRGLYERGLAELRIVDRRGRVITHGDGHVGSNAMQYRLTGAGAEKAKELSDG